MKKHLALFAASLILVLMSCNPTKTKHEEINKLLYNQVGYVVDGPKIALVADFINEFVIVDKKGNEIFTAVPQEAMIWELSGDAVRKVDFTTLNTPGEYTIILPGYSDSYPLTISQQPWTQVSKAAIKAFYLNRTSIPIEPEFGGIWARPAGHPDTLIYIHSSAADENRPEGTTISSPLGWYDAGDYNKYVVNSGITTYTMLRALVDYPSYFDTLNINIPESGGNIPDLLAETLFNLQWVLTMQDPNDGGVYHKLTTKQFEAFVMPHEATNKRYVVAKGTAATLNYAALAAKSYNVLKNYQNELPELANECLQKAEKAWKWAVENPNTEYIQPDDIATGGYGDKNFDDEWFWAASELYIATGKSEYLNMITQKYSKPLVPTWNQSYALGFMSLLDNYNTIDPSIKELGIINDFLFLVDEMVKESEISPYGISITNFSWGSTSQVANEGMLKLFAHKLTGDIKYINSAISDLDYILGRNATGFSFVTGFGTKKVMNIHHRPSGADNIIEPVPGFLVGGPNISVLDDCGPEIFRSPFPAKSFVDLECSYSTNEIAINWNAPLVYLAGGIDALTTK